jgi:hypothetical protein
MRAREIATANAADAPRPAPGGICASPTSVTGGRPSSSASAIAASAVAS